MPTELSRQLLTWYEQAGRSLPWRADRDPYRVWISEIMLQQTRVETVIPYFERWLRLFPTVADLAAAPLQEVLTAWEGLGYYSRARSLHRAAQIVTKEFGGRLPEDPAALRKLPGIGPYTAAAILSIAFGQDIPAVDGNIRRVYSRVYDVAAPLDTPESEAAILAAAQENLPPGRAGDFNQALMDLGAGICVPANPRCLLCPITAFCQAYQKGIQDQRPVILPKAVTPFYLVTAAVIHREERVLIARRPEKGLLGGLWEFPGGKVEAGESLPEALVREIHEELGAGIRVGAECGVYRHAFTHFRIELHAFFCELTGEEPRALEASEIRWVTTAELTDFPMGKVDRLISRRLQKGVE